tara:strand:- start:116 stop:340 length:225 start_codon:yes stop_codon:yes gene_type:complete
MFKAMLLICSLVHAPGGERSCFELHDMEAPNGYTTEKKCMARIHEMADMVRTVVPFPYELKYKCENKTRRTNFD